MKLRVTFKGIRFYPDYITNTYNNTTEEIINVQDLSELTFTLIETINEEILDDCNDVIGYNQVIRETLLAWEYDPQATYIALLEIPSVSLCDEFDVRINATYNTGGDWGFDEGFDYGFETVDDNGFDEGFDLGFGNIALDQRTFKFENTFKLFGYDLGNNDLTRIRVDECGNSIANPEFCIFFALDEGHFDCGFNFGFEYSYKTYANFNAYRKPFTDEVYYFDNTSSDFTLIEWKTYIKSIVKNDCNDEEILTSTVNLGSNRNGIVCNPNEFKLEVRKQLGEEITLYIPPEEDILPCGCNCRCSCGASTIEVYCEEYLYRGDVYRKPKDFPTMSTFLFNDCKEECVILDIENKVRTTITAGLSYYYRDDLQIEPFLSATLTSNLINKAGNIIEQQILYIDDMNKFMPSLFEYFIPRVGDYIIQTALEIIDYNNQELCKIEIIDKIKGKHWLEYTKIPCGSYSFENCTFDTVQLQIDKLEEKRGGTKVWKLYRNVNIPKLSKLEINEKNNPLTDGVYQFTITRANDNTKYIYFEAQFCDLNKCLNKIMDELICNPPCDDRYQHNFTALNVILPISHLLLQKLSNIQELELQPYTLNMINTDTLQELYTIHELIDKLYLYCDNCNGVSITNCDC